MLPGYPRAGDYVLFNPPEQAYSEWSAQCGVAGDVGVIFRVYSDSYALVSFDRRLVLVNTAYLCVFHAATVKRSTR
jgi:hypothetical protein